MGVLPDRRRGSGGGSLAGAEHVHHVWDRQQPRRQRPRIVSLAVAPAQRAATCFNGHVTGKTGKNSRGKDCPHCRRGMPRQRRDHHQNQFGLTVCKPQAGQTRAKRNSNRLWLQDKRPRDTKCTTHNLVVGVQYHVPACVSMLPQHTQLLIITS